ncbi:MAG: hypothetical protein PVH84_09055 [Candidatus Aminicenantes bacterium]|jgi:hypothetical protein
MKKLGILSLMVLVLGGSILGFQRTTGQRGETQTEIVTIKYIDVKWAEDLLHPYSSRLGRIRRLHDGNKLVIEDTPENVEKILAILKEIDIKPLDLQFNVDLILGSAASESEDGFDRQLKSDPIMKELSQLLQYKSYKRLDTALMKVQDNKRSSQRMGGDHLMFRLQLHPRYIKEEKDDSIQVELYLYQDLGLNSEGKQRITSLVQTTLSIKSGERTVVGVSKLNGGDKALILILSGSVVG